MAFRVGDSVKLKDGLKDAEYEKWDLLPHIKILSKNCL